MRIMFEDLTYEAQVRLLDEAGISSPVEMRWHILPVAFVDLKTKLPVIGVDDFTSGLSDPDDDY
jgi:hypothetical protein